ncbi:MAG: hypothetical protein HZB38_03320 [Planctomycetes bacterium]|nr:hypothetical protein [Planctomycetota bacterium]
MNRIKVRMYKTAALIAASGTLLAANNCLPQDYFATLAGDTLSLAISEVILRLIGAFVDGAAAAA